MKNQIKVIGALLIVMLAFASCIKMPMACCDVPAIGSVGIAVSYSSVCSMDAGSYEWDFGDGTAKSTDANPTHIYLTTGNYTVKMMAMSKNGKKMDEITKPITIN